MTFLPLRSVDGYLPIEDHGLIGDGRAAALVGRDGSIPWLCAPRFDSPPLFCGLLDKRRGGGFRVHLDDLAESRQSYEEGTCVLVTELRSARAALRITDAFLLAEGADLGGDRPAGRCELLRIVDVLRGPAPIAVQVEPWGGARMEVRGAGLRILPRARAGLDLQIWSSVPLCGVETRVVLEEGARMQVVLSWSGQRFHHRPYPPEELLEGTRRAWRRWAAHMAYDGPARELVRRSAATLKLLHDLEHGAIIAAPTSSLPESIGGSRNWDYRYAWIRDAAFSVFALRRIGLVQEAYGFLGWVLDAVERSVTPKVLYTIDGHPPPKEEIDPRLEGYRASSPVRWGNAAAHQRQNDAYGEILDCAFQWTRHAGRLDAALWRKLSALADAAAREWRVPDHGIWEVRTESRLFTYSAALCHVALDRAAAMSERLGLPGPVALWRAEAEEIRRRILEEAWSPSLNALGQELLGQGALDASLLALPLRGVVDARHPRMVATVQAIRAGLSAGRGLLYRYDPDLAPDGVPGHEGAFLLCSFWLVEDLAHQGHLDEALALFEVLCEHASPLGLLPEEIDPATGGHLGNFPQALSHVGLISSAVVLSRQLDARARWC